MENADHMNIATKVAHIGAIIEEAKRGKYRQLADSHFMHFMELGMSLKEIEVLMHILSLMALMQRIGDRNNPDRVSKHTKSHYWRQLISFTIHKFVSRHIGRRICNN